MDAEWAVELASFCISNPEDRCGILPQLIKSFPKHITDAADILANIMMSTTSTLKNSALERANELDHMFVSFTSGEFVGLHRMPTSDKFLLGWYISVGTYFVSRLSLWLS